MEEFLTQCRRVMRLRRLSRHTETSYLYYIEQFIRFHNQRPETLTPEHVRDFLTHLAVDREVAASTQNVAFNALLFLYRQVLALDFGSISGVRRAQRPQRLPIVLSPGEVKSLL